MIDEEQPDSVENWLRRIGMSMYTDSFFRNGYDTLEICRTITDLDLDTLHVKEPTNRRDLLHAARQLKRSMDSDRYRTLNIPVPVAPSYAVLEPSVSSGSDFSSQLPLELSTLQLTLVISDRLDKDHIRLAEEPYFSKNGPTEEVKVLASKYAKNFPIPVERILESLLSIQTRLLPNHVYEYGGLIRKGTDANTKSTSPATLPRKTADDNVSSSSSGRKQKFWRTFRSRSISPVQSRKSRAGYMPAVTFRAADVTMDPDNLLSLLTSVKNQEMSQEEAIEKLLLFESLRLQAGGSPKISWPRSRPSLASSTRLDVPRKGHTVQQPMAAPPQPPPASPKRSSAPDLEDTEVVTRVKQRTLIDALTSILLMESIDLTEPPYSNKDGSYGIPFLLAERYARALRCPLLPVVLALDNIRCRCLTTPKGVALMLSEAERLTNEKPLINIEAGSVSEWLIQVGLPMYRHCLEGAGVRSMTVLNVLTESDFRMLGVIDEEHLTILQRYLVSDGRD